ncbi:helix-turn-helix transcriptional regulator [Vagococcus sp. DIV0080]|uniref:Helix-turn-helix transcriptional regulator n=2 Tax=Candidatus Vagococcus giribetii TaxID=2230876 RepID=A0ABS3HSF4_9ENTE|nr:helix-turn-helix transcriptional regulator [Vagococcus sp. DIV0080]MBO0476686.1 helix-turn-helix transcriptional regulator [Vagococcus sp. DIV0080]
MVAVFIYNILLIILYSFSMTFSLINYKKNNNRIYLIFFLLMLSFLGDNIIIYMTEFLETFANSYNQLFMTLPIIKTIIFLTNHVFCLWCISFLGNKKIQPYQIGLLVVLVIWMMSIPFYMDSALNVWLYYLPNQLFLIYLGCYAFYLSKQKDNLNNKKILQFFGYLFVLSGICILLEDSYVIFNIDQYSNLKLKIYNRNISEDIFSTIMSSFIIIFCSKQENNKDDNLNEIEELSQFSKKYDLTQREQEVLALLLKHYSNQEIADELFLSIGTVKTHVHNIYVKLDINKRATLFSLFEETNYNLSLTDK